MEQAELDGKRLELNRAELIERMTRIAPENTLIEAYPGIFIYQSTTPTESDISVLKPAFCVIAQGSKDVLLNDEPFHYDSGHYLISTLDLPIMSNVVEASKEKPYLNLRIDLEPATVAAVMLESGIDPVKSARVKAMDVSPVTPDLLEATLRLVKLLDDPHEMKLFAHSVIREIIYRLLKGRQGERLSHLVTAEGDTRKVTRAVEDIREHLDHPLKIEEMARRLGMSVSGFHNHFKSVTAMSPLQFQKQIRLQEARRLMLGENLDIAAAGFKVGYEDASYFSRDYKKFFGTPPHRDIARLRSGMSQAEAEISS